MCTVIARWQPGERTPLRVLAMRDEFAGRDFDLPGAWWPEQPSAIGGRDRRAGGTWCASDVAGGTTAVVLNRPDRRVAEPGGASRGVLPLLALAHGERWGEHVTLAPMAGFNLVLLRPDALVWWSFDGAELHTERLAPGTYQWKPSGRTARVPEPLSTSTFDGDADDSATDQYWSEWVRAVDESEPTDDGSGLVVRRAVGDESYETVFGQLIAARPGWLRLDYRARVAREHGPWTTRSEVGVPGSSQPGSGAQRWVS